MRGSRGYLLLAALLPLGCWSPARAGTFECGTSDSTLTTQELVRFYPFRAGVKGEDLIWRDVEFMWDSLYAGGLTQSVKNTLTRLASTIVDTPGKNPFGAAYPDFYLVYEYFRREGKNYTLDAADTAAIVFGSQGVDSTYWPRDRSHADCYLDAPSRGLPHAGMYRAGITTDDEDVSTDRPVGDVRTANSLRVKGPPESRPHDESGTGWTSPDSLVNAGFVHEFQHGLPPGQSMGFSTEFFSAAAEAVAGNADTTASFDVPYTWSLLADAFTSVWTSSPCGTPSGTCVRSVGDNYQGRSAFAAYLAYNFRGADTTAMLPVTGNDGMGDDLLWRWVRGTRSLSGLRDLLGDGNCGTCAGKNYFRPGGVVLDTISRMALLHHNWRVANYVNNSDLDEGQYGYPPHFGFAPARQLKAWQGIDPFVTDDIIAIPPEVTLNASHRTRELALRGERSFGGNAYPLVLQPFGAEYWVVKSDPSIWSPGQDLVVRVTPEDLHLVQRELICGLGGFYRWDARLVASVVAYAVPSGVLAEAQLWEHPEWAARAIAPVWVDVDSLEGPLEFEVPSFGDSVNAVLLVLSLADGPSQQYAMNFPDYVEALHYRVDLGLRVSPFLQPNPLTLAASVTTSEDWVSWSPSGTEVVFQADSASVELIRRQLVGGAEAQTLTTGRYPDWSPRGDLIAVVRDSASGHSRVWLHDTVTAQLSPLTVMSGRAFRPVFSPNGRVIAYALFVEEVPPAGGGTSGVECPACRWELRRVNVDGTNDSLLLRLDGDRAMRSLRWSPDGRWIFLKKTATLPGGFLGPDELWVVAGDGTQSFTRSGLLDDAVTFDLHPGGGPLALEQVGGVPWKWLCSDPDSNYNTRTTWVDIPFRRLAVRDTLSGDTQARFYRRRAEFNNPRWSPDGTRIAYSSGNDGGDRNLFVGQVSFNHVPSLLVPAADFLVHTQRPYELYVSASDPDSESVAYDVPDLYLPQGASFTPATRRFAWASPGPVCSEHFVVFRALDGSGGVASKVVKITAVIDSIGDLNADLVGDTEVWLTWTAPGDTGALGQGVEYELRYALIPLNEATFGLGSLVTGMPSPAAPGTGEAKTVAGLGSGTTYYFAIRTRDAKGNWSLISNLVQVTTTSGGGGGISRAVEAGPEVAGNRQVQPGLSRLGGLAGERRVLSAEMALDPHGGPIWSVRELGAEEVAALGLGDSVGVLLQGRDPAGGWITRGRLLSEAASWRFAVRALRRPGRIVFNGRYGVRQAWSAVELDGGRGMASLVSAQSTSLGDVEGRFDSTGTATLGLGATDTLTLGYELLEQGANGAQDWFLLVGPPGSEVSTPFHARPGTEPTSPALPTAFALRQNRPNPFSGTTRIHFELPAAHPVRLEVFDAQGRRVRVLADHGFPAGFHAVEWDHRADDGHSLAAGVYLYRLQAGEFRDQKKLVLLAQ